MNMYWTIALLLITLLSPWKGCMNQPTQVVFEIAENVSGLIILVENGQSPLTFEKRINSYHLSIDSSGIIEVRDLITLDGHTRLTVVMENEVIPSGFLFYTKPKLESFYESDLSFDGSMGDFPNEEKALWIYEPTIIINEVRTHAFFVGTLDGAKEVLNEMRDELWAATKAYRIKALSLPPEEWKRRESKYR